MKILVFDTETTGLPEGRNPSILETEKWPYIVQLSYIYYDSDINKILNECDMLINIPSHINITEGSTKIHGITKNDTINKGVNIRVALNRFNICLKDCDIAVAHNISFDKRLIMVESIRNKMSQYFTKGNQKKPEYCTMKNSVDICKIIKINNNNQTYYKYPKLIELYTHLFDSNPSNLHNAFVDILLCLRCYCKIELNNDILTIPSIYNLYQQYNIY